MINETFVNKVKSHFDYLVSEYGFNLIFESNSPIHPKTDGVVNYKSKTVLIIIDSEIGQAALRFVRVQDDENFYLDPVSIHEFLATNEDEKQILLSMNPEDQANALAIFNKHFLFSAPDWKSDVRDTDIQLDTRLRNYAKWLREHADDFLVGDLSLWAAFYEYKVNRLIANEIRQGGSPVVKAIIKDENGKPKMIERPIFQRERHYLAKLKEEAKK